jgi:hypothetical protein
MPNEVRQPDEPGYADDRNDAPRNHRSVNRGDSLRASTLTLETHSYQRLERSWPGTGARRNANVAHVACLLSSKSCTMYSPSCPLT